MMVLSAMTVGMASGVAGTAFPEDEQSARNKLSTTNRMNILGFMIFTSALMHVLIVWLSRKSFPHLWESLYLVRWIGLVIFSNIRCSSNLVAGFVLDRTESLPRGLIRQKARDPLLKNAYACYLSRPPLPSDQTCLWNRRYRLQPDRYNSRRAVSHFSFGCSWLG